MMSQEKLLLKERLELILPDWTITDELEACSEKINTFIESSQMNQIIKLGLFVSGVYPRIRELKINFLELNK